MPVAACWPGAMMPMPASPAPAAMASAPSIRVGMLILVAWLHALVDADRVAAGDVAEFVGDDALQLVDVVRRDQQA